MKVATAPTALMVRPTCQWVRGGASGGRPFLSGEGQLGEHADGVQRDEVGDVSAEHDDECSGQGGEHEDAVGEDEPIAAVGELAGEEAVAGDDPGQAWKVGVGGVGGEDQDCEGGELEEEVHEGLSSEHGSGHDRQHGFAALEVRV